jgi:hypothetical protein
MAHLGLGQNLEAIKYYHEVGVFTPYLLILS